jgi:diacylglycerol kinase
MEKELKSISRFSLLQRKQSFYYAFTGIRKFFREETNAWIHLVATIGVVIAGIILRVNTMEWIVLSMAMGFVWSTEIFNTAIERAMDLVSKEQNPSIGFIKDVSAAAVLLAAITAAITGCLVFIPKIL